MGRKRGEMTVQRCGAETRRVEGAPVAQARPARRDGWTKAVQRRFLEVLRATANVREAARAVGRPYVGAYRLKQRDPGFAAAWREALEEGYAELEMMLLRQSLYGTERTELIREGEGRHGKVKATKTVHSFPLATAVRLHLAHRDEVLRHRAGLTEGEDAERPDDPAVVERVRRAMADIRARLAGSEEAKGNEGEAPL